MKKSTEFVFQLLITIVEPLITLVSHILDQREADAASRRKEDDSNETA